MTSWPPWCYGIALCVLVLTASISLAQEVPAENIDGKIKQEVEADPVAQRFQCDEANRAQQDAANKDPAVKEAFAVIAVVFRDDDVGCRQVKGVLDACKDLRFCQDRIAMRFFGYRTESQGVRTMQQLVADQENLSHLVIGPSDSGVFIRAAELLQWPADRRVPIISPIVTAAFPSDASAAVQPTNSHTAWFFSTNVNALHRSEVIVDLLSRKKIQSISVLYSDSEFSRQLEAAVSKKFSSGNGKKYTAYRYENVSSANGLLGQIIRERPGAVGIIGLRSQIGSILEAFDTKNVSWNSYLPLMFTAIDVSQLQALGLYYPRLKRANERGFDDVYALSYDTMIMMGGIVLRQSGQPSPTFSAVDFQSEFASMLDGKSRQGARSGMKFDDFENVASLEMRTFKGANAVPLDEPMEWYEELSARFDARYNRFGQLMLINIGIVITVVLILSAIDIQRSYFGNKRSIWLTWPFLVLVLFNIASALLVYLWLAESQQIRWDNSAYAFAIALGFSALLKSTLFETEAGSRIGVQALYDRFVGWLNTRIMVAKHERSAAIINYIAYRNTLEFLEGRLRSVYRFAESPDIQGQLMKDLDAQIEKIISDGDGNILIRKRIVCATGLMKLMSWTMLQQNRVIPSGIKRWQIVNPEHLVDISAEYLLDNYEHVGTMLKDKVNALLDEDQQNNPERAANRRKELDEALEKSGGANSDVYLYVRILFVHYRGKTTLLVKKGLLPENWVELAPRLSWWRRMLGMRRVEPANDAETPQTDETPHDGTSLAEFTENVTTVRT